MLLPRDPIWKLEAALKGRPCKEGPYAPPVHVIKLTARQEITPYKSGCGELIREFVRTA